MTEVDELIGTSSAIARVRTQVEQLLIVGQRARHLPPILLLGETGTGKGLLARLIHREGPRSDGPFMEVNCSAIPDGLLEAELFGFERGAFTDARHGKPGLLQAAHRGTLFLDEIGLLPASLQPKLLKALEDRAVRRLGSARAEKVDVQIIAASNEHLATAIRAQRFRADLYHRIAVLSLTLPALRERGNDVLVLADHFLARTCKRYGLAPTPRLTADARTALSGYRWPGNVRELSNVIESAALLAGQSTIAASMLGLPSMSTQLGYSEFDDRLASLEREQLLSALAETNWNVSRAAKHLGISRNRLRYRIEKHQLTVGRNRQVESISSPLQPVVSPSTQTAESIDSMTRLPWEGRHVALLRVEILDAPRTTPRPPQTLFLIGEKIRSFGGSVEELGPTTLIGAFGIEPMENPAATAALAALRIHRNAEQACHFDRRSPTIKIALHSGRLLVGQVARRTKLNFEDKQAAESILANLSEAIRADRIVVSREAAPFLERRFELEREGHASDQGALLYWLSGPERSGFGLAGRMLTQFVGRHHELESIVGRLSQVQTHHGQVVAIVGDPGVGKSRLAFEVMQEDRVQGWRVLSCRGMSYGASTPLLPIVELLKSCYGIVDDDTPEQVRAKVRVKGRGQHNHSATHLTALLALLDVPVEDSEWRALEPHQRRWRTWDAVKDALLQESLAQPVLIIFEDLHWIDGESQGLLDSLVESLRAIRLLLLVTYRPDYRHGWAGKAYYAQLHLSPLEPGDTQAFLDRLMGEHSSLQPLKLLLLDRTEGNPLFLEESVRSLVETEVIEGSRGAYRTTTDVTPNFKVPSTIQAILAARIARLPPEDRRLLQAATVIGRDVPYALLVAIWKEGEETLSRGLARLQEAELLYETALAPNRAYMFKHALTQEVTYESLTSDHRRELHGEVVRISERVYADRLSEHVERLAQHAMYGELWDKAARYGKQAGARALDRSSFREAIANLDQAQAALQRLPETRQVIQQRIALCFEQRNALQPLGEFHRVGEVLDEGRELSERLNDEQQLAWTLAYQAIHHGRLSEHGKAIEAAKRACSIAARVDDLALGVVTHCYLGQAFWWASDFSRAVSATRSMLTLVEGSPPGERFGLPGLPAVLAHFVLSAVLAELGEFFEAVSIGESGLQLAEAAKHSYSEVWMRLGLGYVHLRQGNCDSALKLLLPALEKCRKESFTIAQPFIAACIGSACVGSKRPTDAVRLLDEALSGLVAMRVFCFRSFVLTASAKAYLALGETAKALELAQQSVTLAHHHEEPGWEAWALKTVGDILSRKPARRRQAEDVYRRAWTMAERLGMTPLLAECELGLNNVNLAVERATRARE